MKKVVITGAEGNLGRVVVRTFLDKGYKVLATVLNRADAGALGEHADLEVSELNLLDETAVQDFVSRILEKHTSVDAGLMLAGGFAMGGIDKTGIEDIKKQFSVNFETAYSVTRELYRHMKERGSGRLVLVGTRPALEAPAGKAMIAYSLSKSLLFRLAELLNEDAKGTDVVTSVIVPSTIDTPANRKSMPGAGFDDWVKPEQIAELLHLICSETGAPLRETVLKIYNKA